MKQYAKPKVINTLWLGLCTDNNLTAKRRPQWSLSSQSYWQPKQRRDNHIQMLSLSPCNWPFSRWTWVSRCLSKQIKDNGSGGDDWSYKAPVKSSPPTNQHRTFYRPDALPVAQPTVSNQSTERNYITFYGLAYPKLTWGLPILSLTTNSSWLPWGRVAMTLISPLMPVPQTHTNAN